MRSNNVSDFATISNLLANWSNTEVPRKSLTTTCCERLRQALQDSQRDPEAVGTADIVGLVRHVLRHEELTAGGKISLEVPATDAWPSADDWEKASCNVLPGSSNNSFSISCAEWEPSWLEGAQEHSVLHDALKRVRRRHNQSVTADPDRKSVV